MKFMLAILCSIVVLTVGDVAHLRRSYLPPARTAAFDSAQRYSGDNNYSERLTQVQVVPSASFSIPSAPAASYTSSSSFNAGYANAPARLTAPSFSQNFASPAAFPTQRYSSARLAAPSRQYISPEVETFEPLVQTPYSAPAVTYNAPSTAALTSSSFSASSNLGTKYSADGGYVY